LPAALHHGLEHRVRSHTGTAATSGEPCSLPLARIGGEDLLASTLIPHSFALCRPVISEEIRERALEFRVSARAFCARRLLRSEVTPTRAASVAHARSSAG